MLKNISDELFESIQNYLHNQIVLENSTAIQLYRFKKYGITLIWMKIMKYLKKIQINL